MLSRDIQAALFVERDHCVDNRLLAQAMASAAAARGADLRIGSGVHDIIRNGSSVGGVTLASGERITADHVVLAAGAWSAQMEGLARPLPVKPIRGQMLALDARTTATFTSFEPVIGTSHCYMIPRSDGRLVIGATVEDVGFDAGPTPEGLAWLIEAATAVVPGVGALPVLETWAGYRPGTPDDWPILGLDPEMKGLHYATGHYRNGILLAPVTAEVISASIDGSVPEWAKPFAVERFR